MSGPASFKFFPAAPSLSAFVEYLYSSYIPREVISLVDPMRLPEVEAQIVFAIEEGDLLPGGRCLGGGERACLFMHPAHLQMIPIPGSIRAAVGAALTPAGLRVLMPKGTGPLIDA